MDKVDSKKDARQVGLSNVSKLSTYQINQYIYSNPRKGIWQRLKEAVSHE
ncbi:hypothetical protein [Lentilactobacillus buchneri]|nr:hypothetical protein [Lentilactobacillus buchneri]